MAWHCNEASLDSFVFCFDFNLHISQWASTPGEKGKGKWWQWLEAVISLSFSFSDERIRWVMPMSFIPPFATPTPTRICFQAPRSPPLSLSLSALITQRVTDVTQHTLWTLVKIDMMSITKNERKWKSAAWRTEFAFYRRIADMHAVKYDGMTSMVSAQILKRSVIREGDRRIVLKQL